LFVCFALVHYNFSQGTITPRPQKTFQCLTKLLAFLILNIFALITRAVKVMAASEIAFIVEKQYVTKEVGLLIKE